MFKVRILLGVTELDEGRVEDIKKRYGQDPVKLALVDRFATAPGNNKYLDWMMKHHEEADSPEEMLGVISDFDKKLPQLDKKDINQYDSFDDLAWIVKSTKEPTRELERRGTIKLYEDDKCIVYRPINKEASCKLGASTKWCISATKSNNHFSQYAERGVQHFFIKSKILSKEDPNHMIAYSFEEDDELEIFNAEDDQIERGDVVDVYGEELERKIFILCYKHYYEDNIRSEVEPPDSKYDIDTINLMLSDYPIDEKKIKRRILDLFGMLDMIPGQKDTGNMMTNPNYNERSIRALLNLNSNIVNKILHQVVKNYYQIQEYIPKRLVKKILDFEPQKSTVSELKVFLFNKDKKIFKFLR